MAYPHTGLHQTPRTILLHVETRPAGCGIPGLVPASISIVIYNNDDFCGGVGYSTGQTYLTARSANKLQ